MNTTIVVYEYVTPGTYTITLTIIDHDDVGTTQLPVTISVWPPPLLITSSNRHHRRGWFREGDVALSKIDGRTAPAYTIESKYST